MNIGKGYEKVHPCRSLYYTMNEIVGFDKADPTWAKGGRVSLTGA